jgi:hypothetical protein
VASQIPTTPDILMLNLQSQVMTWLSFPAERVLIDARDDGDDTLQTQAEQVVILRVEDGAIQMDTQFHGGRFCVVERLTFTATLLTRVNLDAAPRDDILITDPNRGHLVTRHKLYDALLCYLPLDASGNMLGSEPVKAARSQRPRRYKRTVKPGWAHSALFFTVPYQLALTQTPNANF